MRNLPTIIELQSSIENEIKNKLGIIDDGTKKNIHALSSVIAGQMKLLYLGLSDAKDNVFADRASSVSNGGTLERIGNIQLNRNPNPATQGVFEVSVIGELNSVIRSGLTFKSNDDSLNSGQLYITESEVILSGDSDVIIIRSLGTGVDFDLNISDNLTITEPVIGVEKEVSVVSVSEKPLAGETIEDYRAEIILNQQLEPSGGSPADYILWASDAQGVSKAYPYVKNGDGGTVQVYIEATEVDSVDGFGTPSQATLDAAESVILFDLDDTKDLEERGRKPIQAFLEMLPIDLIPIDINITGLSEDTTDIRDLISDNIKDYLAGIRPFVSGADIVANKSDVIFSAKVQSVVSDSLDSANYFETLDLFVSGVNQISYIFTKGDVPYLRNIEFL